MRGVISVAGHLAGATNMINKMRENGMFVHLNEYLRYSFVLVLFLAIAGCSDSGSSSRNINQPDRWFEGGTLHNSTIKQWTQATHRNKMATAADWLAATKWKNQLRSNSDFNRLKAKARMLVSAIDEVALAEDSSFIA